MIDPRTWSLRETDAAIVRALRNTNDNPALGRPIDVRFSGSLVATEYFQRLMVETGWEIIEIVRDTDGPRIALEWFQTADENALRDLCDRVRKIEDAHGVVYEGWSIPIATGELSA